MTCYNVVLYIRFHGIIKSSSARVLLQGTIIEEGKFLSGEQGTRKDETLEINDADIGEQIGQLSVSTRRKRAAGNQGSWSESKLKCSVRVIHLFEMSVCNCSRPVVS